MPLHHLRKAYFSVQKMGSTTRKLLAPAGNYDYVNSTIQAIVLHFMAGRLTIENARKYRNYEEAETLKGILAKYEPAVKSLYATR